MIKKKPIEITIIYLIALLITMLFFVFWPMNSDNILIILPTAAIMTFWLVWWLFVLVRWADWFPYGNYDATIKTIEQDIEDKQEEIKELKRDLKATKLLK